MEYRSHLPQKGIGEWQRMSNATKAWWLLCVRGCQRPGLSKITLRKESGSDSSLHAGLQVHNSQLGPAYLYITDGITGSQLGGVPSGQKSMGRAALAVTAASPITYLVEVEGRIVCI